MGNAVKQIAAATAIGCVAVAGSYFGSQAIMSDKRPVTAAATVTLEDHIFRRFDLNRNEELTLAELGRALPTQAISRTLDHRFSKLDSNGNGIVSRQELAGNRSYLMKFVDLNQNNRLDPDERNYVSDIFQ